MSNDTLSSLKYRLVIYYKNIRDLIMSIKSNTITLDNSQIITSEEEAIMLSRDTDFETNYNVNQSLQSNKTEQNSIKTPQKEIKNLGSNKA